MTTHPEKLKTEARRVDEALARLLPPANERPARLHKAMHYSLFAGGKRLRPILCIRACEACGGLADDAIEAACALEILHTSTLVHDDLPAMDDDTLRRGKPTCHIQFDEATAILAGDALLSMAFEVLARQPDGTALVLELAQTVGSRGVIGGQAVDLAAENQSPDAETVAFIHTNKTAALLRASVIMGGICAGADSQTLEALATYGENIGLAFQITDDLLDETATVEELGKDIGSDQEKGKMTWQAVHGLDKAKEDAAIFTDTAREALALLGKNARPLQELAKLLLKRRK